MNDDPRDAFNKAWSQPEADTVLRFRRRPHKPGTPFELIRGCPKITLNTPYIMKGLLNCGQFGCLWGKAGSGKTFLALHLSLSVAAGRPLFDCRMRQTGVVYLAAEAGEAVENRIAAAIKEHGFPEDVPLYRMPHQLNLGVVGGQDVADLIKTLHAHPDVGLVTIDTLAAVLQDADENGTGMAALVSNIIRIRLETGCAVLIVHHCGKNEEAGLRGHTSLIGALDMEAHVTHHGEVCQLHIGKLRDGEAGKDYFFRLSRAPLGTDDDGDTLTTCVVHPVAAAEGEVAAVASRPRGRPKKSDELADVALRQLTSCVAEVGEAPPASNHIPRQVRVVPKALWRRHLEMAGLINQAGSPREEFRRIIVTLTARGRIKCWDDVVWLIPEGRHKKASQNSSDFCDAQKSWTFGDSGLAQRES